MFKEVNPTEYVQNLMEAGAKPALYTKSVKVKARKGTVGEQIITKMADGLVETTNEVKNEGDWIITNPTGEEYIIKKETFEAKYNLTPNDMGEYTPKPSPQKFLKINEDISFTASWGEKMNIAAGGYLNVSGIETGDVYGIQKDEFKKTYAPCDAKGIFLSALKGRDR